MSAVDGGAFLTHLSFSLPSIKHPWGLLFTCSCVWLLFSLPVCVRAIHSCLLMFWRSTVRLSRGIAFRLRHSSETFLAFYSLIKTAGLPWVLCVSGTLLPLPVPRWTTRTCVCVWAYCRAKIISWLHTTKAWPGLLTSIWGQDVVKDEIDWQIFLSGRPHLNDAMGETCGGGVYLRETCCDIRGSWRWRETLYVFSSAKWWRRYEAVAMIQDGTWWH